MKYDINGSEVTKTKAIKILKYRKHIKSAISLDIQCNCCNINITPNGVKYIKQKDIAMYCSIVYYDFVMKLTKSQFKKIENKFNGHAKVIITDKKVIEPYEKYNLEYILKELLK